MITPHAKICSYFKFKIFCPEYFGVFLFVCVFTSFPSIFDSIKQVSIQSAKYPSKPPKLLWKNIKAKSSIVFKYECRDSNKKFHWLKIRVKYFSDHYNLNKI